MSTSAEAQKSSMLSDENSEVSAIERDIQGIYEEIQEYLLPKGFCIDEHLSKDMCISKLLNSAKEDYLKDFEQEYHLTERIVMVEENGGQIEKMAPTCRA